MNSGTSRIALGAVLAFVGALGIGLANGLGALTSLGNALIFSLIVGAIIAVLNWAIAIAQRKGYSPWLGFGLVVVLNVIGLLLLLWLPARSKAAT
ncbi:MAG: hypothetical protein ABI847_21135 [Anaerolineales bacterium]